MNIQFRTGEELGDQRYYLSQNFVVFVEQKSGNRTKRDYGERPKNRKLNEVVWRHHEKSRKEQIRRKFSRMFAIQK